MVRPGSEQGIVPIKIAKEKIMGWLKG